MISKHTFSILISIPVLLLCKVLSKKLPYVKQGFFCDDDTIRYPYHDDTINNEVMHWMFLISACFMITSSEYFLIKRLTRKGNRLASTKFHAFLNSFLFTLGSYICSELATSITTTFIKRTISCLRPNFLAVCQPDLQALCSPANMHRFVEDYICMGSFSDNEYLSFPSGHSSAIANFAVFFIIYLHKRNRFHEVIRIFLQFGIFLFTVYVMCSRVRDYKHRLTDVLAGGVLGAFFALFFVTYIIRGFKSTRYQVFDGEYEFFGKNKVAGSSESYGRRSTFRQVVADRFVNTYAYGDYGSFDQMENSSSCQSYPPI